MKKLDYTSLFLSMVSLVWMLTMLQELPAIAQRPAASPWDRPVVAVASPTAQPAGKAIKPSL